MEQKAFIIRPGALGDTLMLLPALNDMGKCIRITVAGREPGLWFLRKAGFRCVDVEGGGWHRLFQERPDPHQPLPVPPQDKVVAYLHDSDGRIVRNLKVSFPGAGIHVFPAYPAPEGRVHVARHVCETLALAGFPVDPDGAMKRVGNRALLKKPQETMPGAGIIIHPGSGSPRKNFPPEFWLSFFERISREPDLQEAGKGAVLLGPAEEDLQDFFRKRVSGAMEVVFCPRNDELVSLLGKGWLYAGHDSGITHLAAMLGTPTLVVFRQDNLSMWRPLGPAIRAVRSMKACKACLERMVEAAKSLIRRKL